MYKGKKGKKGQKARGAQMAEAGQYAEMLTPRNEQMEKVDEEAQDETNMAGAEME